MLLRLAVILLICVSTCRALAAEPQRAAAARQSMLLPQTGHQQAVTAMAFSPDGRTLVTSGAEGTVKLWDVPSRRLMRTLEIGDRGMKGLTWSTDGAQFCGWDDWGGVILSDREGRFPYRYAGAEGYATPAMLVGRGDLITAGWDQDGDANSRVFVRRRELRGGGAAWSTPLSGGQVMAIAATADGTTVAAVSYNVGREGEIGQVAVLNGVTGQRRKTLSIPGTRLYTLSFSSDGELLAVSGVDSARDQIAVWVIAARSGKVLHALLTRAHDLPTAVFLPGTETLAVACDTGEPGVDCGAAQLWNVRTGKLKTERRWPGMASPQIAYCARTDALVFSGQMRDATPIQLLNPHTLRTVTQFPDTQSQTRVDDPSPDGRYLALTGAGDELLLWDRETVTLQPASLSALGRVWDIGWSPDSSLLAVGGPQAHAILDVRSRTVRVRLEGKWAFGGSFAFSRDQTRLLAHELTSFNEFRFLGDTLLWNAQSGALVRRLRLTEGVQFSPTGKFLVGIALHPDGEGFVGPLQQPGTQYTRILTVWDAATGALLREFGEASEFQILGESDRLLRKDKTGFAVCNLADGSIVPIAPPAELFALSPDGERLLLMDNDRAARVIETRTGHPIYTRPAPNCRVHSVALAADGKTAAFGMDQAGMVLIHMESGATEALQTFEPTDLVPRSEVMATEFVPGGRAVLGRMRDSLVLWDVSGGGRLLTAVANHSYQLAPDGNSLMVETLDGTMRVYDTHSGLERITLASFPSRTGGLHASWLAYTLDGRYSGTEDAERFIAWSVQGKVVAGSLLPGYRIPDLLEYVPWSFGERQAQIEAAEALYQHLPDWALARPDDERERAELLRGLEHLSRYDTPTLREVLRSAWQAATDDPVRRFDLWLNGMIANRYLFSVPAVNPKRPQDHPLWPLYQDGQGQWRLDRPAGLGAASGDPLAEFDAFRRHYPRRPPASGP